MDIVLANRSATVRAIRRDVDDRIYVAVTVDDDPASEMHLASGRLFHFGPDEVEPWPAVEAQ